MFLDIIFGLLIAIVTNLFLGTDQTMVFALYFGVFCALVPDLDFIVYIIRNKFHIDQFAHEHRDLLHKPIIFIIIGMILLRFSFEMGFIWIIGTLYHLIHDTLEGGWGIRWLYPFSNRYYVLASYSPKRVIRSKKEQQELALLHGDPDWFKKEIRINRKLIIEISMIFALLFVAILAI